MPALVLLLAWYSYRALFHSQQVIDSVSCGPPWLDDSSDPACSRWAKRRTFDTLGVIAAGLALMGWLHNRTVRYSGQREPFVFDAWFFKACGVAFLVAMAGLFASA